MKTNNAVLTYLRGESGSIVYRFWKFPLQRVSIALRRVLGVSWITFYAKVVDSTYKRYSTVNAVGEAHLAIGAVHLECLKRHGLQPHHMLLDFGCGVGRSAQYIAAYLEPAHYVGIDISESKLRLAQELIAAKGLSSRRPVFVHTTDLTFDRLAGYTFDYLWAHSVFNHTPDGDVQTFFENVRKVVRPGSGLVLTYIDTGDGTAKRRTFKDWSRPLTWWHRLGERYRFTCESCEEWMYPDDRAMQFGDRKMILKLVWK